MENDNKKDNKDSVPNWIIAVGTAIIAVVAVLEFLHSKGVNIGDLLAEAMFIAFGAIGLWLLFQRPAGFWLRLVGALVFLLCIVFLVQTLSSSLATPPFDPSSVP